MNDELNTKNMENQQNQPVEAQPASNEVLTPDAQQPMVDPIEAPVEPEVKTAPEAGTFTPPVAGMVPTGWAFPQDLASSLAMTTEDPEVATTGADEVNQPAEDMDAGGPSDELPESTEVSKKEKKLRESEDFEDDFEEEEREDEEEEEDEPEEVEEAEETEEPEDDCEACEDLEENPEEIPDLLDTIADILRKKDLEDSDEFEDEDEEEEEDEPANDDFVGEGFSDEDLEMDEAVKYPAGSKPEIDDTERPLEDDFDQDDDIIRQYEKRALARKALIEKLKKPLWEKELDEIADPDERDKEEGYKSINDAIDEGALNEKFDRALRNPLEESHKEASGWSAHNNLGRLSEKRLNFRKMVGKGFLD